MLFVAFIAVALLLIYIMLVRPVMLNAPLLSPAFAAEASFRDKLRVWLLGWKTKIVSRLVLLSGFLIGTYDQLIPLVSSQDWTPITSKLPAWSLPVGMVALGWLFSYLRKVTENPPQIITQKNDAGEVHVVDLIKPLDPTPVSSSQAG